jgi:hypothetical protein
MISSVSTLKTRIALGAAAAYVVPLSCDSNFNGVNSHVHGFRMKESADLPDRGTADNNFLRWVKNLGCCQASHYRGDESQTQQEEQEQEKLKQEQEKLKQEQEKLKQEQEQEKLKQEILLIEKQMDILLNQLNQGESTNLMEKNEDLNFGVVSLDFYKKKRKTVKDPHGPGARINVTKSESQLEEQKAPECAICLASMADEDIDNIVEFHEPEVNGAPHRFHRDCARKFRPNVDDRRVYPCPLCRFEIEEKDFQELTKVSKEEFKKAQEQIMDLLADYDVIHGVEACGEVRKNFIRVVREYDSCESPDVAQRERNRLYLGMQEMQEKFVPAMKTQRDFEKAQEQFTDLWSGDLWSEQLKAWSQEERKVEVNELKEIVVGVVSKLSTYVRNLEIDEAQRVSNQFYLEMQEIMNLDGDGDEKRRASVELARRVDTGYSILTQRDFEKAQEQFTDLWSGDLWSEQLTAWSQEERNVEVNKLKEIVVGFVSKLSTRVRDLENDEAQVVCNQFYLEMQKIMNLDGDDDRKRRESVVLAFNVNFYLDPRGADGEEDI